MPSKKSRKQSYGDYIVLNGQKISLSEHPTDFCVHASKKSVDDDANDYDAVTELAGGLSRARASNSASRDAFMDRVREDNVAHHVYVVEGTQEEMVINDRLICVLRDEGTGTLESIIEEHHLDYVRAMGNGHILRVTDETGRNPLKTANMIAERDDVVSCEPDILQQIHYHQAPALFSRQWYLTADLINHPSVRMNASSNVPEAWLTTTGNPDIVVAVIDDGIDIGHPAFAGTNMHPDGATFVRGDFDPDPETGDFHGTPVASIAVASHGNDAMRGIAPDCTLLPIQIPFGRNEQFVSNLTMLEVFEFVSARADVVNCSFGFAPRSFQVLSSSFRIALSDLARNGGRQGQGLVIVFSAGNDDAPTSLTAAQNVNGVRFLGRDPVTGRFVVNQVPAGRPVFTGYPMVPDLVVVGAMSSRTRKSGYSNWGPHISVTAPSSNGHELRNLDPDFSAPQIGLGQIAASNRQGFGTGSNPLFDDPSTAINESNYTQSFGGTSGAAPVVAGVAALILSVNPTLTATQVKQILQATADRDLDPVLDLVDDPNVQGITGEFNGDRSAYFGFGKVNAAAAVLRASALPGAIVGGGTPVGARHGSSDSGLLIPDRTPQGVIDEIEIPGTGPVTAIEVSVDITHTYRGDLRVSLISPEGFVATLHDRAGRFRDDIDRTYDVDNTADLAAFVDGGIEGGGTWRLLVSDHAFRDVGTLNSWSIDLRP